MIGDGVDWSKVLFGQGAMHHACRLVLQDMGEVSGGKRLTVVVGYLVSDGPILSDKAKEIGSPHDMIVGDLVIRPHEKHTGTNFVGSGIHYLLMGGAFDPENWDHRNCT